MTTTGEHCRISALTILWAMVVANGTVPAQAQTEIVLHGFNWAEGKYPTASVIRDSAGNLYGTTAYGGASDRGVVFKLTPSGDYTVLHSFTGGADGGTPYAGVIRDPEGNLYGTTSSGGSSFGVVFKLDASGTETVLHTFTGGADGNQPTADVIRDSAGNLYGTTSVGGPAEGGVVFKLDSSGTETVLYAFTGGADGAGPDGPGGLVRDSAGNLYGTAGNGGLGHGVVFKVDATGNETVLHSFTGGTDGDNPKAGLVRDSDGNLYGSTFNGGNTTTSTCPSTSEYPGCGVVFKVDAGGTYTVLYSFPGGADGQSPNGSLIRDSAGNLYGTTQVGGSSGFGTIFRIGKEGSEAVLYSFAGNEESDGDIPYAGVIRDPAGNLYGTTPYGGIESHGGYGVVFKLAPLTAR